MCSVYQPVYRACFLGICVLMLGRSALQWPWPLAGCACGLGSWNLCRLLIVNCSCMGLDQKPAEPSAAFVYTIDLLSYGLLFLAAASGCICWGFQAEFSMVHLCFVLWYWSTGYGHQLPFPLHRPPVSAFGDQLQVTETRKAPLFGWWSPSVGQNSLSKKDCV